MKDALAELRDALAKGTDPDSAIMEIARDFELKAENLRVRARSLLSDPSIARFQDPDFRKTFEKNQKIKAAKDAALSAQIAGGDKDAISAILQGLGTEFSHEEQQQVILDYMSDLVSIIRESK